jgi:hypothetical protein
MFIFCNGLLLLSVQCVLASAFAFDVFYRWFVIPTILFVEISLTIVKTISSSPYSSNKESLAYWYKLIRAALLVVPTTYEIHSIELGATPPDKFLIP